ncbi:unnamed protein product [Symbiodinium natans]|uniref:GCN5-related N-acetyltransferase Rv2170-like domain-containing protein n=1 Tax=Symbiodinium natans TaxID=878477 RepID=A0A812NK60_9DINO|nr:unnamed protein product [Symbiodinium natans]
MSRRCRDRSRSPRRAARAPGSAPGSCALEACKDAHRWAAYECHMSKPTFKAEACQVRTRVIAGHGQCRTFILCEQGRVPKSTARAKDGIEAAQAAVTVRINPHHNYSSMWGQVMHMSAREERQGHGSKLVIAMEEFLRQEGVDTVVAYPAATKQAMHFWTKMGYAKQQQSFLPDEELIPRREGGPLWPEVSASTEQPLERWEKRLSLGQLRLRDPKDQEKIKTRPGGDGRMYRELVWKAKDLRRRKAAEVTLTALELQALMSPPVRRLRGKQPSCKFL